MLRSVEREQQISVLENELFLLKLERLGTPPEALATLLHNYECKGVHSSDACGWGYVKWDKEPKKDYLERAESLLALTDILTVLRVLQAYFQTTELTVFP